MASNTHHSRYNALVQLGQAFKHDGLVLAGLVTLEVFLAFKALLIGGPAIQESWKIQVTRIN